MRLYFSKAMCNNSGILCYVYAGCTSKAQIYKAYLNDVSEIRSESSVYTCFANLSFFIIMHVSLFFLSCQDISR